MRSDHSPRGQRVGALTFLQQTSGVHPGATMRTHEEVSEHGIEPYCFAERESQRPSVRVPIGPRGRDRVGKCPRG